MSIENNIYGDELKAVINGTETDTSFFMDKTGEIAAAVYRVFPGVTAAFYNIYTNNSFCQTVRGNYLEISHCREGRIECEFEDSFYYLSSGDLSIGIAENGFIKKSDFPLRYYHGVSILIDLHHAPDCFSCFLSDVNVSLSGIVKKYCRHSQCYIARSKPYVTHIFSELYSVPESIKKGCLKIKVLELLLLLSSADTEDSESVRSAASAAQMRTAREISGYIMEHMDDHITIPQLSEYFHISATQIKNLFKAVYGQSVYSYAKTWKMQTAALLLKTSNISVLELAVQLGYSNASKFSQAFRDVMGILPREYRNLFSDYSNST